MVHFSSIYINLGMKEKLYINSACFNKQML